MPLDKKKLQKAIEASLDKAYKNYVNGDEEALSPAVVADDVVDMMHSEIETKLEKLIDVNLKLVQSISAGLSAITPPGQGAAGAAVFNSQINKSVADMQKMLIDLKKYRG